MNDTNSARLLDAIKDRITQHTAALFKQVEDYGGQFSAEEMDFKSFTAPAAFVSCLGWQKVDRGNYLGGKHIWRGRMAIFIATKDVKRDSRMREAMLRADVLTSLFSDWKPDMCAGKTENIGAENLYSRSIDKKGLALWMVDWWQEIEMKPPVLPRPDLETIAVHSTASTNADSALDPAPKEITVTHELEMKDGQDN
ncbi:phage protein Gp37 [Collimonas antrihumi]|uniref:phage protein Gp37 n=1 Tax=Collimonas antrihumi TaxID=1940615 RepID=UPI001B8BD879|nr:phage protein Gp37 [Collimonas antrihumi]